jgi:protein transport protein SEC24
MDLAGIDADKAYVVELQHDDKLDPKGHCYLQTAMLYTTRRGHRRIRVHTLRMSVAATLPNLFRQADLDTTVATLCRRVARHGVRKGLGSARDMLTAQCVDILTTYRKHCAVNPSPGQLILPEALKLMPIYCLGMLKGGTFRQGTDVRVDERIQDFFEIHQLSAASALPFIYPRMFPLHTMGSHIGNFDEDRGCIVLPNTEGLSSEKLNSNGIYLLHDLPTAQIFIWIGEHVNPRVIKYLFNCDNVDMLDDSWVEARSSERICNIIKELRRQRPESHDAVRVISERKHDPMETIFLSRLVEDKTGANTWSYVEYLCHLHRHIQSKLANAW